MILTMSFFTPVKFFLFVLTVTLLTCSCLTKTVPPMHSGSAPSTQGAMQLSSSHGQSEGVGLHSNTSHGGDGRVKRFPIFGMDFGRVQTPMIIGLWLFCACLGKIAFHMTPKLSAMLPESCLLILMGLVIGGIFMSANPNPEGQHSPLTANTFFLYLLPPIILDAGYFMPNRLFFDHLGTILTFAVVGTIWNTLTIGISLYALTLTGLFGPVAQFPMLHIFLFASLISAVDPVAVLAVFEEIHVEEVLFILVFGESLLNDGVTVVLYHMFEGFSEIGEENLLPADILSGLLSFLLVALGGTMIGIIWGFLTAFVTRFTYQVRVIEPIFIFIMSYLAYLNAELFHWSGILAITFCGITMKNYTEQNMSEKSQTTTKYVMKMISSSSETVIFLFLGVSTVHGTRHDINLWFIFFTIFFCSVYRVLGVLILSAVCNRFRVLKIDFVQKFVMSYGGLRGAVAFALVITINSHHIPLAPMFITTTIAMVFFTVFVQGMTIKPLVQKLGVKRSEKRTMTMNERLHGRSIDYLMVGLEDITGKLGNRYLRECFKRINTKYLQPCFVRNVRAKEPKLFETLSQLKMQDAMNYMHQPPTSFTDLQSYSKMIQTNHNVVRDWNLDIAELGYKGGERDISDARFHHILSDDYHPIKTRRQSTYKRHAVTDEEIQTSSEFENKMYQKVQQVKMTSIRNRKIRKMNCANASTFGKNIQQNDNGVRLRTNHIGNSGSDNPAYEDTEGIYLHLSQKPKGLDNSNKKRTSYKGPALAETVLPWKSPEDDATDGRMKARRTSSLAPSELDVDLSPTLAEKELPWKRSDIDFTGPTNKQSEFPPWLTNEHYIDYYSPPNVVLGQNTDMPAEPTRPNLRDFFKKRHSSANIFSQRGSSGEMKLSLREGAKDDIFLHKKVFIKDSTGHRRESTQDIPEFNVHKPGTFGTDSIRQHHPHDRRASRESCGMESLLNTIIVEEDQKIPSERDETLETWNHRKNDKKNTINEKNNDTHL